MLPCRIARPLCAILAGFLPTVAFGAEDEKAIEAKVREVIAAAIRADPNPVPDPISRAAPWLLKHPAAALRMVDDELAKLPAGDRLRVRCAQLLGGVPLEAALDRLDAVYRRAPEPGYIRTAALGAIYGDPLWTGTLRTMQFRFPERSLQVLRGWLEFESNTYRMSEALLVYARSANGIPDAVAKNVAKHLPAWELADARRRARINSAPDYATRYTLIADWFEEMGECVKTGKGPYADHVHRCDELSDYLYAPWVLTNPAGFRSRQDDRKRRATRLKAGLADLEREAEAEKKRGKTALVGDRLRFVKGMIGDFEHEPEPECDSGAPYPLLVALRNEAAEMRRDAAEALARYGAAAEYVIPELGAAARDEDSSVRTTAGAALARIGTAQALGTMRFPQP